MSGKPNLEGVAKVRDLLVAQSSTYAQITALRERIKADTATLETASLAYSLNATKLRVEMQKMDLTSTGNNGHERRMHDFLCLLTEATLKGAQL